MTTRTLIGVASAGGGEQATSGPEYDARDYGTVDTTGATSSRAAIQAAIDACQSAGGGTVLLPAGTLHLDNTAKITASGVRLLGQGYATVLEISANVTDKHVLSIQGTSGTPIKGVSVQNLRIQGHGDDSGTTADRHGIYARWSDHMQINTVWAQDCTFAAIRIDDSEHAVLSDITVLPGTRGTTGGWYGIELANYTKGQGARGYSGHHVLTGITTHMPEHSIAVYLCDDVTITGVTATGGQNDYTFNWTGARRVALTDFICITNGGGYIYTEYDQTLGTSRTCADLKFANGFCKGIITAGAPQARDLHGIYMTSSPDTSLVEIYLDCSTQTGAQSSNAVDGINADAQCHRLRVTGCTINNPIRDGIRVSIDGAVLSRNRIVSTRGTSSTTGSINLTAGQHHIVQHNRIESSAGNGIYCAGTYTQISDNIVTSCTADGIVTNAADTIIRNNLSTNHTGWGFKVNASAARVKLDNNFAQTNTAGNYTISGTQPMIGRNNKGVTNDLQAKSSTFTLAQMEYVVVVDATSSARTVTLPAATACHNGKTYIVKCKVGSTNNVTVSAAGSDTIDGSASITLTAGQSAYLVCDGTSLWNVV